LRCSGQVPNPARLLESCLVMAGGLPRQPARNRGLTDSARSLRWAHDSTRHADSSSGAPSGRRAARVRGRQRGLMRARVDDHLGPSEMAAPGPAALRHAWWSGRGCQPLSGEAQPHGLLSNRCRHRGQRVEQEPMDRASNRPIDDHAGKSASWTLAAPATPLRHAVMWLRASSWACTAPRPSSRASSVKDSALPAR
jgi:hypothetical protein